MQKKNLIFAVAALVVVGGLTYIVSKPSVEPPAPAATAETWASAASTAPAATDEHAGHQHATDTVAAAEAPAAGETAATPAGEEASAAEGENLLAAPAAISAEVQDMMSDRVLGNPAAPITIIEYASMTCSHCADFAVNKLPAVKAALIDSGKAKLVFREFPLDGFALKTSMMLRCAPKDKFFDLLEVVFQNQPQWTKSEDPLKAVTQYGVLAGMSQEQIDACLSNEGLEEAIVKAAQYAQKRYEVKATPTFVFNDGADYLSGAQDVTKFEEVVNKISAGK